jgi:hypothetical protein
MGIRISQNIGHRVKEEDGTNSSDDSVDDNKNGSYINNG